MRGNDPPIAGASGRWNKSLQAASWNKLLQRQSIVPRYMETGCAPKDFENQTYSIKCSGQLYFNSYYNLILRETKLGKQQEEVTAGLSPTYWDDKEPHVTKPVWGLRGEVVHKKSQNRIQVVLRSCHCNLYRNGCLGVTVAAVIEKT